MLATHVQSAATNLRIRTQACCFCLRSIPLSRRLIAGDDSLIHISFSPNGRTNERESLFLLSRRWRQFSLIPVLISENYDSTGRPTYRRRTFRTIIGFLITTLLPFTNDFALSLTAFRFENQPIDDTINRVTFDLASLVIYSSSRKSTYVCKFQTLEKKTGIFNVLFIWHWFIY